MEVRRTAFALSDRERDERRGFGEISRGDNDDESLSIGECDSGALGESVGVGGVVYFLPPPLEVRIASPLSSKK